MEAVFQVGISSDFSAYFLLVPETEISDLGDPTYDHGYV
jgi:hypothetical protein